MVSKLLANLLEAGRNKYNAQFMEARHFYPGLTAEDFFWHIENVVDAIIQRMSSFSPTELQFVLDYLYETSLPLVGKQILGPRSAYPVIITGWTELIPSLSHLLLLDPIEVIGGLTNAIYNLVHTPGGKPDEWVLRMKTVSPNCKDLPTFQKFGQVCAWRCGMAHFRETALQYLHEFPVSLSEQLIFNAGAINIPTNWIEKLQNNPWQDPSNVSNVTPLSLKKVARLGGFRGFGGLFQKPPILVNAYHDAFHVRQDSLDWLLYADRFGTVFIPFDPSFHQFQPVKTASFELSRSGNIRNGFYSGYFPELDSPTSSIDNGVTLAITLKHSHCIYLLAVT